MKKITIISILAALLVACNGKNDGARLAEDKSAKIMLQGVWLDTEDGSVSFRVIWKGLTVLRTYIPAPHTPLPSESPFERFCSGGIRNFRL